MFHLTLGGALQGAYLDGAPIEVVEQAIDHYDVAIETAPKNAEAYTYRGIAFEQLGEDSLAIEDFDEASCSTTATHLLDYFVALFF